MKKKNLFYGPLKVACKMTEQGRDGGGDPRQQAATGAGRRKFQTKSDS